MGRSSWLLRLRASLCIPSPSSGRVPKANSTSKKEQVTIPIPNRPREVVNSEHNSSSSAPPSKTNNTLPSQSANSNNPHQVHHDRARSPRPQEVPKVVISRSALDRNATQGIGDGEMAPPSPSGTLTPQPSESNLRSRSNSKDSTSGDHELRDLLYQEEQQCHLSRRDKIIPKSRLESLITVPAVAKDIQARNPNIDGLTAQEYAERVCESAKPAKQLYATLAYVKRGGDIGGLLDEGVCDEDLPLTIKTTGKVEITRKNGEMIQTLVSWKPRRLQEFDRWQFCMTAPVFEEMGHYCFEKDTILPFLQLDENVMPSHGAYSKVFPVHIHPDHHNFWMNPPVDGVNQIEPLIAVKQLFSPDEADFEKENTILRVFRMKNHPHLIKLLATFKKDEQYHLMFPYADANLRAYWDKHPVPAFDEPTILWSIRQMRGIADALQLIHNFSITYRSPESSDSDESQFYIKPGEEIYGRHGDMKPENILWFKNDAVLMDRRGILQICDFGLGRFHGRDSRSKIPAETVVASPTYEPPECKLRLPVSRAYDLWSLACVYLEFITWLLKSAGQIEDFSNFRGRPAISTDIDEDSFYTITRDDYGTQEAIVNVKVCEWVEHLHSDEKSSQLIHDLLDCTMNDLLVIDAKERIPARLLYEKLCGFVLQAETDPEYMLKPVARQSKARSNSAPMVIQKSSPKAHQVKHFNLTNGSSHSRQGPKPTAPHLPKDLVLRHMDTPSKTWPSGRPD